MEIDTRKWFLDFSEHDQSWHIDLERVPENPTWKNIGYGSDMVLDHFTDMVDVMTREFGMRFTTAQIVRLAECTPGLTVHRPTPVPEDDYAANIHFGPIESKERIEESVGWKESV